ncbi:DUF4197 domain-containing protein [Flavilitoribacter nigricans]|uniref:DUF4197 domain-containing protein n=1 Tax=Flavilitoribacter nigricans (strain ATCC 23147 / DSM 23189 / NBRC 102662 / NCIMB 1420 / SS-2) TaxID=1122177 RepID=A0A2D0N9W1_FLAN2|nr:DUF4197 domain-containing protein [Flavilitoribacter nigricans]PHN05178.1 hypothetical protein CRP01_16800 [Flavilitoribacter nigricans DSM 23189 = NBRC 102662]
MIKRLTMVLLAVSLTAAGLQAQGLKGLLNKAKEAVTGEGADGEVGMGLKEALNAGVGEAVTFLSTEDGYYKSAYKILLPEEVQQVTSKLKSVPGFGNVEEDLLEKMNRAAEIAAEKAKPIFVNAIKQMTIKDAMNLLMGEQDAATRYLERTTYQPLYDEFRPVVISALDEVNAREYWKTAVTAYNKIPFVKKTNPELDDHVTNKALVGLFSMIEKKEADIRENPAARTSELLQKVFSKQDK